MVPMNLTKWVVGRHIDEQGRGATEQACNEVIQGRLPISVAYVSNLELLLLVC